MGDLHFPNFKVVEVAPTTTMASGGTATLTTTSVDTWGFENCLFLLKTDTMAASSGITVFKIQESSDDAAADAYADIAGASIEDGTIIATSDNSFFGILLTGCNTNHERYLDAVVTTNDAGNAAVNVIAILFNGKEIPPSDDGITTLTIV